MKVFFLFSFSFIALFLVGCNSVQSDASRVSSEIPVFPLEHNVHDDSPTSLSFDTPSEQKYSFKSPPRGHDSQYSFQSFIDEDFQGSDFTIGSAFEEYDSHTSYSVSYLSQGILISGTLHIPKGEGPFPVLILNHGYFPPETYTNGYGFGREQKYFVRHGYAVLHIDYRGYGFSEDDDFPWGERQWAYLGYSTDAFNAIYALEALNHPNLDMNRVGMFGHSLGGAVTLNVLTAHPDLVDAAVIWGSSSGDYEDNFNQWTRDNFNTESQKAFEDIFGDIDDSDSFRALSAETYFDRIQTPLSIHHGTEDEDVPLEWSQETYRILTDLGKEVEYYEYEGAAHVFWNAYWDQAIQDSRLFFDTHLLSRENNKTTP